MADVPQLAGGAVHIPTEDTGVPSTLAVVSIVQRACRIVGSYADKVVRETGFEAFQDCINDMNIREKFDFTTAKDTDQTLVVDQREYSIPASALSIKEVVLVDDTETPEEIRPLGYIDWDQNQRLFRQAGSGYPTFWTARDLFFDRKIELMRAPDQTTVDRYKLRIWYHLALEAPPVNDINITIRAPRQVSTIIQRYIEYRLLITFAPEDVARRREVRAEYVSMKNALKGMETRSRPGGSQIRPQGISVNLSGGRTRRWPAGGR